MRQLFGGIKHKAILTSAMRKCEGDIHCYARVICCCHPVSSDAYMLRLLNVRQNPVAENGSSKGITGR